MFGFRGMRSVFRRLSIERLERRQVLAAGFAEFIDPHPASDNQFGASIVPLASGNVVVTSPYDDAGGTDAGAVYLFSGRTGALISTLRGSLANDHIGSGGVTALTNGNFVVASPDWDNGTTQDVGAATWGDGTLGLDGVVAEANSLVGTSPQDRVAYSSFLSPSQATIAALSNGNYVVFSPLWDNGIVVDAGAITWGDGTTGIRGQVSPLNSLVGSTAGDQAGLEGAAILTNGNYVVMSRFWDHGDVVDAGAATFGDGNRGVSGSIGPDNSLFGTMTNDRVGFTFALPNGNYYVFTSTWHNLTGAVTFGNGNIGIAGPVSDSNSLVGSTPGDGGGNVTVLKNGNYVVRWDNWDNGSLKDAGAVTWGSGTTGIRGVVGADNSLVGTTAFDNVGRGRVTALSDGDYVVSSPDWNNGSISNAGAVTWGDGTAGIHGAVSATNSLVGSHVNDQVGSGRVTPLTNGNYVVASPSWDNGSVIDAGAATLGNGNAGTRGEISASNSLIGATAGDQIAGTTSGGILALTNGNYVVRSPNWDRGDTVDAGAATFGNGSTGVMGTVTEANSLVGSVAGDKVGSGTDFSGGLALSNGNYVVLSPLWDNAAIEDAGAATFGDGQVGIVGDASAANSLVGSHTNDHVGGGGGGVHSVVLPGGNYVIGSPDWDNGNIINAGAATLGDGTKGTVGAITSTNSLVGGNAEDHVSDAQGELGVRSLKSGNYLVMSSSWDKGNLSDAGAITFGDASLVLLR